MKRPDNELLPRRGFLAASSLLMLGTPLVGFAQPEPRETASGKDLPDELTPEETRQVEASVMGRAFASRFGHGYSCAESSLGAGLELLGKPEELVWAAAGFGGGLQHKDLCGLLTGSIMSIGFAAGMVEGERKQKSQYRREAVNELWDWWIARAPLHCLAIREGRKGFKVCHRLGRITAVKVEELLGRAKPAL